MTEEANIQTDYLPADNELLQIIEVECMLLATIADICDAEFRTYEEEIEDMNVIKRNAYKVIFAAQKKLLKFIKDYEQTGNDKEAGK
jgi:hypothetical protein